MNYEGFINSNEMQATVDNALNRGLTSMKFLFNSNADKAMKILTDKGYVCTKVLAGDFYRVDWGLPEIEPAPIIVGNDTIAHGGASEAYFMVRSVLELASVDDLEQTVGRIVGGGNVIEHTILSVDISDCVLVELEAVYRGELGIKKVLDIDNFYRKEFKVVVLNLMKVVEEK